MAIMMPAMAERSKFINAAHIAVMHLQVVVQHMSSKKGTLEGCKSGTHVPPAGHQQSIGHTRVLLSLESD